ncbi:unnamed protein product [Penicillium salamii]|uniref:histidine kinase n=1 Tax=Penicillium salamii TaxID=1612424 RepID=A0A9W4NFL2_9EURO|nr:unnamed protein product [Penicillium salamii]CAG8363653.1 unnamed protein product [Penicillium salamii]CAG8373277.1 unnamed protein product [Penicillium salamii]CAG8411099.1 unnamed protein product [Penicillium salamii]
MSSPTDVKDYGDWTVIHDENGQTENKLSDRRRTLARTLSIPKTMCIMSDTKTEISTVTELLSPKLKLPQLGNESAERVFPVRSAVSFDSTPSSALPTPSLEKLETPISPFSDTLVGEVGSGQSVCQQKGALKRVNSNANISKASDETTRLHQKNRDEGKATSTATEPLTARHNLEDGLEAKICNERSLDSDHEKENRELLKSLRDTLQNGSDILGTCTTTTGVQYSSQARENIAVQPFGAILVLVESDGNFEVKEASSNSKDIIGYSPEELFGIQSFCDLLQSPHMDNFLTHSKAVLDGQYDIEDCGPEVFSFSVRSPGGDLQIVWCNMHSTEPYKGYVICEIQPENAAHPPQSQPKSQAVCESKQLDSTSGAYFKDLVSPVVDESNRSKASELLNKIPRTLRRLANAQTLERLVQQAVSVLQEHVQFDRTSIYHFDSDRNGIVLADATTIVDLTQHAGVHFPESAFSEDLRRHYTRKTVCFSYSAPENTAQLVCRTGAKEVPLDLSQCYLSVPPRVSDSHTENPVKACLSIHINVFGKLWGLISCQSYTSKRGLHPLDLKLCWFIAEAVSSNIERLSYSLQFQLKEPSDLSCESTGAQAIKTPQGDLLSLFGADYAAASILGEAKILGRPTDSQEVLALLEYMRVKENDSVCWSTDIAADFPDLNYSRGFHHLAGLFYVPLSGDGHDFIIFFRTSSGGPQSEQTTQLHVEPEGQKSKRQQLWSTTDIGKASILSQLYCTFTEVWQEKEVTLQNNQLMRLLLANSAHEFRTPLNAIINYLEIALDGPLDQETRDNISRSHSASRSLVYIINDLLNLTNAENGQRLIKDEVFDLSETLTEATDIFWEEARQKHVDLQVVQHAALPSVLGDQRRVRQVITNLISNAVQHTSSGAVTIESCVVPESLNPDCISVEVSIHDTGSGMSQETVETLFCELEQVSNKGYMKNPKAFDQASDQFQTTEGVLGLGLALVARIVRNMNGQLSLKSEAGKGSCFKIRLEFPLPEEGSVQSPVGVAAGHMNTNQDELKQGSASSCMNQEKGGIPCECGETPEFRSGEHGVYIDVNLKTGESRTLALSAENIESEANKPDSNPSPPESTARSLQSSQKQSLQAAPETQSTDSSPMDWSLHVLVAEDEPINSTIVKKRLEKFGHTVHLTSNGKECLTVYKESPGRFDAVLMDLQVGQPYLQRHTPAHCFVFPQMPIVDGLSATRLIREYEQQEIANESTPAPRIPIFAVSASLVEENRATYIRTGFDGWILKPIDFHRLDRLLGGIKHQWVREEHIYQPGEWEEGGWFKG